MDKLSVITSVYNEQDLIETFVQKLSAHLLSINDIDYEIIIVNDGSTDSTLNKLKELKKTHSQIKIVNLSRNFGQHLGFKAGLNIANGDFAILIDSDLQEPIDRILTIYNEIKKDSDLQIIYCTYKDDTKNFYSEYFYKIAKKVLENEIPKNYMNLKIMSKKFYKNLIKFDAKFYNTLTSISKTGFKNKILTFDKSKSLKKNSSYSFDKRISLALSILVNVKISLLFKISLISFGLSFVSLSSSIFLNFFNMEYFSFLTLFLSFLFFLNCATFLILVFLSKIIRETSNEPDVVIDEII